MKSNGSNKRSEKEIEFCANTLLESLRGHAEHLEGRRKLTLRVTSMELPKPLKPIKPRDIAAIRIRLNVSQPVFAGLLNIPLATERSWEQGKRHPSGAALRLLDIARRQPKILVAG